MDILRYIERAKVALKDGEFDLADQYFRQVLSHNPEHPDAIEGLKNIEVARIKKSGSAVTLNLKWLTGAFFAVLGKLDKAYQHLELVYLCKPDSIRYALAFAKCAVKTGNYKQAHEACVRVFKQDATNLKALELDTEALSGLDMLDGAVENLQKLVSLRPNDDKLIHRLRDVTAQAYSRVGIPENLKERRAAIEKKKREAPGTPEFMEKLEKMLAAYEQEPDNFNLGVAIARHYRSSELYEEANRVLGPILDKNPVFEPARREQARVWRQSNELEIAVGLFKELLGASPQDLKLVDEYLDARIALLEQKKKQTGGDKNAANEIERLRLERRQNRIAWIKQILADRPESFRERLELGDLLLQQGQAEEAIPILQRLVHEPSWAGKGYFLLGQCFRAKGDNALAVQQFEKSLGFFKDKGYSHVLSDDLKAVYYYMGIAKEALGDREGARESYGFVYSADIYYKDIKKRYEKSYG